MIVKSSRQGLPPLPKVPENGKGRLEAEITYSRPDFVETRLGSIPADFETYSGWEKRERIYFRDDNREAENRYGRSKNIWRAQPTYNEDGSVKKSPYTETVVAEPKNPTGTSLKRGAVGGLIGAGVGFLVGAFGFGEAAVGAAVGGALGAAAGAVIGNAEAKADRVKLEWQEVTVNDHELAGYIYEIDEDEDYVCSGFGDDRECHWETDDYEHEFTPIIEKTPVGRYFRPAVVHYTEK